MTRSTKLVRIKKEHAQKVFEVSEITGQHANIHIGEAIDDWYNQKGKEYMEKRLLDLTGFCTVCNSLVSELNPGGICGKCRDSM